ncbi:hypothetical protein ACFFRR_001328 [Megaselia abdita]
MELMTVVMVVMNKTVICHVLNLISNVSQVEDVFWTAGGVMVMLTAKMAVMKTLLFVIKEHVILIHNSAVKTEDVFLSCGCAISIMIVVMILMNRLTCVVKEIVPLDGNAALDNQITDAFLNGYSAMEKMIVGTIATNYQKTVLNVIQSRTLSVPTIDVFQSNGLVTFPMIAVMEAMKLRPFVKEIIVSVQSLSSIVVTANAYHQDGAVTTKMIVVIIPTNRTVKATNARTELSSAPLDIV